MLSPNGALTLAIRPERLEVTANREPSKTCWPGTIADTTYLGAVISYDIDVGSGLRLTATVVNQESRLSAWAALSAFPGPKAHGGCSLQRDHEHGLDLDSAACGGLASRLLCPADGFRRGRFPPIGSGYRLKPRAIYKLSDRPVSSRHSVADAWNFSRRRSLHPSARLSRRVLAGQNAEQVPDVVSRPRIPSPHHQFNRSYFWMDHLVEQQRLH